MHSDICVLFSANYLVALPAVHLWGWFSTYPLLLIKSRALCWISARFIIFITKNEIPLTLSCLDKVKVLLDCSSLRPLGQAPEKMRQVSEKLFFATLTLRKANENRSRTGRNSVGPGSQFCSSYPHCCGCHIGACIRVCVCSVQFVNVLHPQLATRGPRPFILRHGHKQ